MTDTCTDDSPHAFTARPLTAYEHRLLATPVGIEPSRIAELANVSVEEIERLRDAFFTAYPKMGVYFRRSFAPTFVVTTCSTEVSVDFDRRDVPHTQAPRWWSFDYASIERQMLARAYAARGPDIAEPSTDAEHRDARRGPYSIECALLLGRT